MSAESHATSDQQDSADLAQYGYKQELKRSLGLGSSFAVAFSYISPSTGIFTLFALGLTTLGGVFIWTWPVVALGQFIIALNFAEVSSHYPVAGSVFQWTKYLASRSYSWFTGWIYLFAGIITVAAVVATLPLALIPALNGLGWHSLDAGDSSTSAHPARRRADHAGGDHGAEHLRRAAGRRSSTTPGWSSRSSACSCSRSCCWPSTTIRASTW